LIWKLAASDRWDASGLCAGCALAGYGDKTRKVVDWASRHWTILGRTSKVGREKLVCTHTQCFFFWTKTGGELPHLEFVRSESSPANWSWYLDCLLQELHFLRRLRQIIRSSHTREMISRSLLLLFRKISLLLASHNLHKVVSRKQGRLTNSKGPYWASQQQGPNKALFTSTQNIIHTLCRSNKCCNGNITAAAPRSSLYPILLI
jgi:hypothetical protein